MKGVKVEVAGFKSESKMIIFMSFEIAKLIDIYV